MTKIVGLNYTQYVALGRLVAGQPVKPEVRRHFELKGWFRGGRLTDDGLTIWNQALLDPPERQGMASPSGAITGRRQAEASGSAAP